jgi:hypothetical protein
LQEVEEVGEVSPAGSESPPDSHAPLKACFVVLAKADKNGGCETTCVRMDSS